MKVRICIRNGSCVHGLATGLFIAPTNDSDKSYKP